MSGGQPAHPNPCNIPDTMKTIQFLAVTALTIGMAKASLVSHYSFDETSGSTAVDSGPAGANGVIGSNVTLGAAGVSGVLQACSR